MPKRKCVQCKERFDVDTGQILPKGFFHSHKCITAYIAKDREKKRRKALQTTKKEHAKQKKEFKARDLPHQKELTQRVFNKMRVLEELKYFSDNNLEPACFSCSKPLGGDQWCCGHYKTVGSNSALRYSRENTHLQHNRSCNMGLSGDIAGTKNTHGYKQGYIERYGEARGNELLEYCDTQNQPREWTCEELIAMRKEFSAKIKALS